MIRVAGGVSQLSAALADHCHFSVEQPLQIARLPSAPFQMPSPEKLRIYYSLAMRCRFPVLTLFLARPPGTSRKLAGKNRKLKKEKSRRDQKFEDSFPQAVEKRLSSLVTGSIDFNLFKVTPRSLLRVVGPFF